MSVRLPCALWLAALMISTPTLAASPQAEGFKKLSGGQIRSAFAGRTFSDDTHFSNRYLSDGSIQGMSMGRKIYNQWKVVQDTLCITSKLDELCYAVWRKGKEIRLVYENSDVVLEGSIK